MAEVPETSIDLDAKTKVMTVQINLNHGPVNAYGTCQLAMEYCCRYFTTLELSKRKQAAEAQLVDMARARAEKEKVDSSLSKLNIILPGEAS